MRGEAVHRRWIAATFGFCLFMLPQGNVVFGADPPASEQQMQRLMETAAQSAGRPDHDFAANSLQQLVDHAKDLILTPDQVTKVKEIADRYGQIRGSREAAYKQSEMDALKLIHDNHSSLTAIENAVQKSDQEHSKVRMAGIKALREATDVLRPEQYAHWRQKQASSIGHGGLPGNSSEVERMTPH